MTTTMTKQVLYMCNMFNMWSANKESQPVDVIVSYCNAAVQREHS